MEFNMLEYMLIFEYSKSNRPHWFQYEFVLDQIDGQCVPNEWMIMSLFLSKSPWSDDAIDKDLATIRVEIV